MAEMKLNALQRMPVRILGAIMNGAEDTGIYRYYSYISGYDVEEETALAGISDGASQTTSDTAPEELPA